MRTKTKVITIDENLSDEIQEALQVLQAGGTVAFPTDTVYGLAASLTRPDSIEQLFVVKQRPEDRAIAVLLGSIAHFASVTQNPSEEAQRLAARFWPGPLTLVVPRHPKIPAVISPRPTIGVRIPDHPVALALLTASGPLAVTSANLSGEENCITADEVLNQLEGRIDLVLDGGVTPGGLASTVVDMTGDLPKILREGPITLSQLQSH